MDMAKLFQQEKLLQENTQIKSVATVWDQPKLEDTISHDFYNY